MQLENIPFRLGIQPIAWINQGIPEFPDLYSSEEIIREMASLGFSGTEMNPKFLAEDDFKSILGNYGMEIVSQWKSVIFSDASLRDAELTGFKRHADFLNKLGCKAVIACEMGGSNLPIPERSSVERLNEEQWDSLVKGLELAGEYCNSLGLDLVYHHHAATAIETVEEIDRLMDRTDPRAVSMLFDTGHAYYGGADPYALLVKYFDRIKYVHLKDVRKGKIENCLRNKEKFKEGVMNGMFTVPGDGDIDFAPILETLVKRKYDGWALIEAEQHPEKANPYRYSMSAKQYIEGLILSMD